MEHIKCDNCSVDLSLTSNSVDYRLTLKNEHIPCHEGVVSDMYIRPIILHNMHFCGLGCLSKWLETTIKKINA